MRLSSLSRRSTIAALLAAGAVGLAVRLKATTAWAEDVAPSLPPPAAADNAPAIDTGDPDLPPPPQTVDPMWSAWAQRFFLADEGRIQDTGNNNISHSEGQGYGMLLAACSWEQDAFNRLWRWTRENLAGREDGLFSWRWEPEGRLIGRVTDKNAAADGDMLIAWALLEAWRRWRNPAHLRAARKLVAAIRTVLVQDYAGRTVLMPGVDGFKRDESVVVNPSYFIYPALDLFAQVDSAGRDLWRKLRQSSLDLLQKARFGTHNLPPNWLEIAKNGDLKPADGFPPLYGFDAIRIPLYIAWAKISDTVALQPFNDLVDSYSETPAKVPPTVDLTDGQTADYAAPPGIQTVYALLLAARQKGVAPVLVQNVDLGAEDYYSATLLMLCRLAYREITP